MNGSEIVRRRMHAQHVWGEPLSSVERVVRHLGAIQAQEYPYAKWSVAQRTTGVDDAAMQRAFDAGEILRTHVLRPTWHFVSPADIRWLLKATAPRVKQLMSHYDRTLGLDDKLFAKTNRAMAKAIEKRGHLTRAELSEVVDAKGQRLGHIVMRAELDAIICSGAMRGKQHTYALVEERAPKARDLSADEALEELARRYFTGHGPATVKDLAGWASLTQAAAKRGLEAVSSDLEHAVVDGRTYWFARASRPPRRTRADLVQLYDETIMGYFSSRDLLAEHNRALPKEQISHPHAILLDGRLGGRWKPVVAKGGGAIVIEVVPFRRLEPAEARAVDAAALRYGRFARAKATVQVVKSNKSLPT